MKRCLICGFAALAFSLNAQAEPKDKDKDKPPKDKDNGAVYSVPDTGQHRPAFRVSTFGLGVASRRFATR